MKKIIMILAIFVLIFIAGCSSTKYVCYNGQETDDSDDCPTYPTITLNEIKASRAVDNYGRGYTLANSLTFTRVNTYPQGGDWYSDVLFSNRDTKEVYEVKLKIDGRTSSITCIEGCEPLGMQEVEINQTQNQTQTI